MSWHLIEDTLGWFTILIGAIIMSIWDFPVIDPILSIGISIFVLWNVGNNLKRVFSVFLQTTPENFEIEKFERAVQDIKGVKSVHHAHCWSIDGESHVLSVHVVRANDMVGDQDLKSEIRALLEPHPFEHITIELEDPGEDCSQRS